MLRNRGLRHRIAYVSRFYAVPLTQFRIFGHMKTKFFMHNTSSILTIGNGSTHGDDTCVLHYFHDHYMFVNNLKK